MERPIARNFVQAPTPTCSQCKHYLSLGPITLASNQPVCGRCSKNPDGSGLFYEKLAQVMIFPCINDIYGCDVTCPWDQVASHENNCRFAPKQCPALACDQNITEEEILQHYETNHADLILSKSEFKVPRKSDYENGGINKLFVWGTQVFIVKINVSDKCSYCSLLSWRNPSQPRMKYSITIEDAKRTGGVYIRDIEVKKYDKKLHDISEMTKIDLELMAKPHAEELVCCFDLGNASPRDRSLNANLLGELECPVCIEYMRPPIFSCLSGHIICNSCLKKLSRCPSCQLHWNGSRMIAIEKMTEHLSYPCKFHDSGCTVTGTLSSLSAHESDCTHRGEMKSGCHLNSQKPCGWQGSPSSLVSHIAEAHPDFYVDIKYSIVLDMARFTNMNAFTEYDNHIFKVIIDKYGNDLHVTVKVVVNQWDVILPIYHFLLDFRDPNNCNRFLILNNICSASLANDDNRKNTLVIDRFLNNLFLKHNMLEFKLSIVKYRETSRC